MKLLVVDDDRDLAESFAEVLELQGYAVTVCYTGEDAVALHDRTAFDVVFLDVRLPGIDGVEALREILRRAPASRVVLVTGFSEEERLRVGREYGARCILRKPVDLNYIVANLARLRAGESPLC